MDAGSDDEAQAVPRKAGRVTPSPTAFPHRPRDELLLGLVIVEVLQVVPLVEGPDADSRPVSQCVAAEDFELLLRTIARTPEVHDRPTEAPGEPGRDEVGRI